MNKEQLRRVACALAVVSLLGACGGEDKKTAAKATTTTASTATTVAPTTAPATTPPPTAPPVPGSVWPGNGHHYLAVESGGVISWEAAKAGAARQGGHLVTITSAGEGAFAFSLVATRSSLWSADKNGLLAGPWLGASQDASGAWTWVTGEPFTYTNWADRQPDNYKGDEHALHFFGWTERTDQWNDIPNSGTSFNGGTVHGYIIEFDR